MTRPRLESERLVLDPATVALARHVVAGEAPGVAAAAGWPHEDTAVAFGAALAALDAGAGDEALGWVVLRRDLGDVIGECGTKGPPDESGVVEIGYGLAASVRGQGFGTEAVRALVDHLVGRPDVRVVSARVHPANAASRALLERLGFRLAAADGDLLGYELRARAGARARTRARPI